MSISAVIPASGIWTVWKRSINILLAAFLLALLACRSSDPGPAPLPPPPPGLSMLRVQGRDIVNERNEKVFLRGVNFGCWLAWEGAGLPLLEMLPEHRIKAELEARVGAALTASFSDGFNANYIQASDFAFAKSRGLNFIRLPFHHRYVQAGQLTLLDQAVSWAKLAGIYVMLDLHGAPGCQNPDYHSDSDGSAHLWEDTAYQAAFLDCWAILAQRYKDEPTVLGYELLNEPVAPTDAALADLYRRGIERIRAIDIQHMILLDGNEYGAHFGGLVPAELGPNLVYVFHSYDGSQAALEARITTFKAFSEQHQVPVMCNEYGGEVNHCAGSFETAGIPYAPWMYKLFGIPEAEALFYWMPGTHPWQVWCDEVEALVQASQGAITSEMQALVAASTLSPACKERLTSLIAPKGRFTGNMYRALVAEFPGDQKELQRLFTATWVIVERYTFDAIGNRLLAMTPTQLTALMQSLRSETWTTKPGT